MYAVATPADTQFFGGGDFSIPHTVFAGGLTSATDYMVRTSSSDPAGNGPTFSPWFPLRTRAAKDREAARILGGIKEADLRDTSVRIKFISSEPATFEIEYGLTEGWPNNKLFDNGTTFEQEHEIPLASLQPDTSFNYWVRLTDEAGNQSAFFDLQTFRTRAAPDETPPRIFGLVDVGDKSETGVTVKWRTNENANSIVTYAKSVDWPNDSTVVPDQALVTEHFVKLTGLETATEYTYCNRVNRRAGQRAHDWPREPFHHPCRAR